MELSREGVAELAGREGMGLSPYLDSKGVKTVGVGSTSSDIPDLHLWSWHKTLTIQEAIDIYTKGLSKYVAAVNKSLTRLEIPQHQFDALVSITYNIGVGGMAHSTFMKKVNAKEPDDQVARAILMWNEPKEIMGRRRAEADLFQHGKYELGGMVNVFAINPDTHHPVYSKGKLINLLDYI